MPNASTQDYRHVNPHFSLLSVADAELDDAPLEIELGTHWQSQSSMLALILLYSSPFLCALVVQHHVFKRPSANRGKKAQSYESGLHPSQRRINKAGEVRKFVRQVIVVWAACNSGVGCL